MIKQVHHLTRLFAKRVSKGVLLWPVVWIMCWTHWVFGEVIVTPIATTDIGTLVMQFEAPVTTEVFLVMSLASIIKSELSYPTNCIRTGARIQFMPHQAYGTNRSFMLGVGGWTSVTEPYGKMKDSDWVGLKTTGLTTVRSMIKLSYTESELETRAQGAFVMVGWGPFRFYERRVFLSAEYEYERFSHQVFGYSGWYLDLSDSTSTDPQKAQTGDQYPNTLVLTYSVTVQKPILQARMVLSERRVLWDCMIGFSPLAMAKDEDFHLLRNKKSTGSTMGVSGKASTSMEWRLTSHVGTTVSVGADYMRTKGKMRQVFYGDDPGTVDFDETGTEFDGLTMWISQYSAHASVGLLLRF